MRPRKAGTSPRYKIVIFCDGERQLRSETIFIVSTLKEGRWISQRAVPKNGHVWSESLK
jgi:hypothetical protein